MNQLEQTIIQLASDHLRDMRHHQSHLRSETEEFLDSFKALNTLLVLAHLAGSGLSEEATKELLKIEAEAAQLISGRAG